MKKKIFNKFDKHAINELPRVLFPGRIVTILTPGETEKAVNYLLDSDILGFDTRVTKIVLSWHDDLLGLHKLGDFEAGTFVELQNLAPKIGIEDKSLQKIYANLFHQKISKSQRLTNWEADVLKDSQKLYAATDAWTCIQIYDELQRLISTREYEVEKVTELVPEEKTIVTETHTEEYIQNGKL